MVKMMKFKMRFISQIHTLAFKTALVALITQLGLPVQAANATASLERIADVYIFAGQSNALGKKLTKRELKSVFKTDDYFSDIPLKGIAPKNSSKKPDSSANVAFAYHLGTASHLSPNGIDNEVSSSASDINLSISPVPWSRNTFRFGPELSFTKKLRDATPANNDRKIMILKVAFGASSLQMHWLDHRKYRFLDILESEIDNLSRNLKSAGYKVNVKAFFWIQGEADVGRANSHYLEDLKTVISEVRNSVQTATGSAAFPLVIARTGMIWGKENNSCLIRCAQQDFATLDKQAVTVDIDDLTKKDCYHYSSDSYITMGERLYEAYSKISSPPNDPFCDCKKDVYTGTPVSQPPQCSATNHNGNKNDSE